MPELKNYKLFISHSWAYSANYKKLCSLLDGASNFVYSNYSIPKDDPVHTKSDTVLYEAIKQKITFCNAIIILAGVYSSYSKWIDKERLLVDMFSAILLMPHPLPDRDPDSLCIP